jgi:hypothetical protein
MFYTRMDQLRKILAYVLDDITPYFVQLDLGINL